MIDIPHTLITRLVVKNYRSLADVDITLKPLTVFVGENGAGKSNLIDVLRFVRDALKGGLEKACLMRGGFSQLHCWFTDLDDPVSIELYFEGAQFKGEYGFSFGQETDHQVTSTKERLSVTFYQNANLGRQEFFFEASQGIVVSQKGLSALSQSSPKSLILCQLCDPRLSSLRDFLANMSFYDLSPAEIRQPQKALKPFPLAETGHNLASALLEVQKRGQDYYIIEPLEVVVEGIDGYQVHQAGEHLVTTLHYTFSNGHQRQSTSHLTYEADGTVRMLAILTALYQERYPSALSIEEPEKALYPRALAVLGDILQEAALSYQILLTTHGPYFIDKLPTESLLVVEKENGVTKIGPIMAYQQESIAEELFSPGELMQIEGLHREGAHLGAKV